MPNLVKVAEEKKLPILGSEPGMVEGGALMTVGIDYYKLGQQTGKMAVKILKGEAVPAEMPVESLKDVDIVLNQATAKVLANSRSGNCPMHAALTMRQTPA